MPSVAMHSPCLAELILGSSVTISSDEPDVIDQANGVASKNVMSFGQL